MHRLWGRTLSDEKGQGLVELALVLPLLLLILLGIADLGRAFYYTVMITGAAREAAAYAATNPTANASAVAQHACNASGLAAFGSACPTTFVVTCVAACPTSGGDSGIRVTYAFSFISAYLVDRVFNVNPLVLRAEARFPGMAP
jgi:Flp pilus assembly protein TadG